MGTQDYSLNNFSLYDTAVVAIVTMLYITSLVLIRLITESLYLFTTFLQFSLPHPTLLLTTRLISFSVSSLFLSGFVCLFLNSTCNWDHTVFTFLWLILFSIITSRSIYIITNRRISSFLWLNDIPVCVCVCVYIYIYMYMPDITTFFLLDCIFSKPLETEKPRQELTIRIHL